MHQVWIHEDVVQSAEESQSLRRRLHIVIGQLAAFGRTTVTKSCRYPNQHWRRTPMGGNGGMHLYLWWRYLPQPLLPPDAPLRSVWLRAIRQHDEYGTLDHQDPSTDYLPFTKQDLRDPQRAIALEPWTQPQQDFINSAATVRTIRGQPGTGKTNALWHAVASAEPTHPLYLSRSSELTQQAKQYLTTVLPDSVSPLFLPFQDFVSLLVGMPNDDTTRQESLHLFEQSLRLAQINRRTAGPWHSRTELLYDELHGHMLGGAVPGAADTRYTDPYTNQPRMARLTKTRYLAQRSSSIGPEAAAAAAAITNAITEHPDARRALHEAFQDLVAANAAIRNLRTAALPEALQRVEYIAVDEAQDLTLTQAYVVLATAAAIGKDQPSPPMIAIAGDDSQTIQPSGFHWPDLIALIRQTGATPEDHVLLDAVRAPARVAQTLQRLNSLYTRIGRDIRPSTRQAPPSGDATTGTTIVAAVPDHELATFMAQLAELPDTFIISVAEPPPSWIPATLRPHVLTAEQVKGLEQSNVAIIGAAAALDTILQPDHGRRYPQLDAITIRSNIDRLRVAASRTSQNLVFVENPPDAQRLALHLDETPTHSADETQHAIEQDHLDPRQVVNAKLNQAQQLAQRAPDRSWQLAAQASREIETYFNPEELQCLTARTHDLRLELATHFVTSEPEERHPDDLMQRIDEAAQVPAHTAHANVLKMLHRWNQRQDNTTQLLNAIADLDTPWQQRILSASPDLPERLGLAIKALAQDPDRATAAAVNIQRWVPFLRGTQQETTDDIVTNIRSSAVTALIQANHIREAQELHDQFHSLDPRTTITLRLKQGRYLDAYHLMRSIGEDEQADQLMPTIMEHTIQKAFELLTSNLSHQAYRLIQSIPEEFPKTARYWCATATILNKEGRQERAINAAQNATQLQPRERSCWNLLLFIIHQTDDPDRILPVADAVIQQFPDDPELLASAATRYAHQGKTNYAIEIYQQILGILPTGDHRAADVLGLISNCYTDLHMYPDQTTPCSEARDHQADALDYAAQSYKVEPRNTAALASILRMMGHVFGSSNIDDSAARQMQETINQLGIRRKTFFQHQEVSQFADAWSDNAGPHRNPHTKRRAGHYKYVSTKDMGTRE